MAKKQHVDVHDIISYSLYQLLKVTHQNKPVFLKTGQLLIS